MEGGGDAIGEETLHAGEDLAGGLQTENNGAKTFLGEDDVCSSSGGICGTSDSDTNISSLQGRSIVHTISRHTALVSELSVGFNNKELVLGKHLRESIGVFDVFSVCFDL